MKDAVITGVCTIGGLETCLGVMDSLFPDGFYGQRSR